MTIVKRSFKKISTIQCGEHLLDRVSSVPAGALLREGKNWAGRRWRGDVCENHSHVELVVLGGEMSNTHF